MKVIVKISGFYAGTWHDAGPREVEMADRVAKPFLPPYGDQLARAPAASKPVEKPAVKPNEKKAG
ncbi:hypothetical protein [Nitrobacter hamburgensis]|uniref:hypothetical protein n=1 Tax=Nitrobacter hamburgensis TaxID=912 RepID=UPI0002D78A12|nr:hypothetical protein [Nitrobacter hamburgensis]